MYTIVHVCNGLAELRHDAGRCLTSQISWAGGLLEVGFGLVVGSQRFMHWQVTSQHNVSAISVSGELEPGIWEFSNFESKSNSQHHQNK